uniref:Uncharacterized protein n=1 Tax=Daphnia galeata TaxID=27404 RepID=A0A8J2RRK9_9CRUS|nr:unnamed protein product [Daphnia galeata]
MVKTIGGKIHAFIESVKYGCVVLSCMFLCFPTEAIDLIKQLTVEFALEDVTSFCFCHEDISKEQRFGTGLYHARDQYAVDLEVTYNSLGVGGTKIRTSTIYKNSLDGLHDISS